MISCPYAGEKMNSMLKMGAVSNNIMHMAMIRCLLAELYDSNLEADKLLSAETAKNTKISGATRGELYKDFLIWYC
jgi:hypothetical protein